MTLYTPCLICGRKDPYGAKQALCMSKRHCQFLGEGDKDADRLAIKFFGEKKNG